MIKTSLVFAVAGFALVAGCASSNGPDLDLAENNEVTPIAQPTGPAVGTQAHFEANADNRVFFALDEYALTPQARQTLAAQAAWLNQFPQTRVSVGGHCDERGTREYNFALGARRAEAAKAFLVSRGVDPSRVETVSYGKEKPVAVGSGPKVWSQNRNATTRVVAVNS